MDQEEVARFLKGMGIGVEEWRVRRLVMALPEILSKQEGKFFYGIYSDPEDPSHISKRTAYKIRKMFEQGVLDPYLRHLDANRDWHPAVVAKQVRNQTRHLMSRLRADILEDIWIEASQRNENGEKGTFYEDLFLEVSRRHPVHWFTEVVVTRLRKNLGQTATFYIDAFTGPGEYRASA